MRPYKYITEIDGNEKFLYKYSDLKKWLTEGRKSGTSGMILVRRTESLNIFRGFGTIEKPNTNIYTCYIAKATFFFGPECSAEEIINPKPIIPGQDFPLESYRIIHLDEEGKLPKL